MDHIRATPGFPGTGWLHEMSLADNLRDLERHAQDFAERRGFTYTVLSIGAHDVIGGVYIYPPRDESPGSAGERKALVRSWVRADHAALDPVLHPRRPRVAGTRLALPLDRVRAASLIPQLRRVPPGEVARVFTLDPDHIGIETFDDLVGQVAWSHHWIEVDGRPVQTVRGLGSSICQVPSDRAP
ncbi:MAG TPA: hypothetical protein VMU94_00685 [Streptosporangiaceae bacterium]|nr:hypothetical protein [Streptosporangiaceae bacterium]